MAWLLVQRRRGRPVDYPYTLDILLVLPFLIDTAGNAANLYDTIDWWDDANHFVNWGLLVAAFCQLLIRLPLGRLAGAAIAVGFGAVTAILWEFGEYFAFIRNSPELATAYTDTLGDLALGLAGSVVAAVVTSRSGRRSLGELAKQIRQELRCLQLRRVAGRDRDRLDSEDVASRPLHALRS